MLEYLRLMVMTRDDLGSKAVKDFDYSRAISSANEAAVLSSVIAAITAQLEKFPNDEAQDVALIADKGLFKTLSKNQRMAVRRESFSWNLNPIQPPALTRSRSLLAQTDATRSGC